MDQPNKDQRASLSDILNYQPERYLTDEDIALIRSTFKDNPRLIHALKKVFLPSVNDASMPVEEYGKDVWLQGIDWASTSADETKALVLARADALKFINGGFIQLKVIANSDIESPMNAELRRGKDSSK